MAAVAARPSAGLPVNLPIQQLLASSHVLEMGNMVPRALSKTSLTLLCGKTYTAFLGISCYQSAWMHSCDGRVKQRKGLLSPLDRDSAVRSTCPVSHLCFRSIATH